jgi:outer membrane biosynthesis protein TonB
VKRSVSVIRRLTGRRSREGAPAPDEHPPDPLPEPDSPPEPAPPAPEPRPPSPEPGDPPPRLRSVPSQEPEPEARPEPESAPDRAEPQAVVRLPVDGAEPRAWNVWELERLADEAEGRDPAQDEELAFLLLELRQFANADGQLPVEFDPVVRESFGDLVYAAV